MRELVTEQWLRDWMRHEATACDGSEVNFVFLRLWGTAIDECNWDLDRLQTVGGTHECRDHIMKWVMPQARAWFNLLSDE